MEFLSSYERRAAAEARKQALAEGLQHGLQQGAARTAREDVLEALHLRFKRRPRAVTQRIRQLEDPSALKELLRTAITAASLEEFEKALPATR